MEEMLKKMRVKYTLTTTLIVGAFLLILMVGIFCMMFGASEIIAAEALQSTLDAPDKVADSSMRCIIITVENGEINVNRELDFYEADGELIVKRAISKANGKFDVNEMYFKVMSKKVGAKTVYAVYDRTGEHKIILISSAIISLLYVASVMLIALIAYFLSTTTLKPVEDSMKRQRDLVANASHELKTPLTIISTNLSVLKSEPQSSVESNEKWISSIDTQISRMNGLIQNMLELSKMEQSVIPKEALNLSDVINGECLAFEAVCFEKNVTLLTDIMPNIQVYGERRALERLAVILLDNAVKYCGEKGKIGFQLSSDGKKAKMVVMNTGAAITKDEAAHVFDRFFRADGARANPDNQSFGLGLAIAQATASSHGGEIVCHGIENKGTAFEVTLPVLKKFNPVKYVADSKKTQTEIDEFMDEVNLQ